MGERVTKLQPWPIAAVVAIVILTWFGCVDALGRIEAPSSIGSFVFIACWVAAWQAFFVVMAVRLICWITGLPLEWIGIVLLGVIYASSIVVRLMSGSDGWGVWLLSSLLAGPLVLSAIALLPSLRPAP
jgi:hypothetical protein